MESCRKLEHTTPRVVIIGALDSYGNGAIDFCLAAGVPVPHIPRLDMAEAAPGGLFSEIYAADIVINCVYLGATLIPPFVTHKSLSEPGRNLRVACDDSCDPDNAYNPMPIYTKYSKIQKLTLPALISGDGPVLTVPSIDHLPSLFAREASDEFPKSRPPSLKTLERRSDEGVWKRTEGMYLNVFKKLPAESLACVKREAGTEIVRSWNIAVG